MAAALGMDASADLFLLGQHQQIVALAAQHALPTMSPWREFAQDHWDHRGRLGASGHRVTMAEALR